jgi:hypothetical protein
MRRRQLVSTALLALFVPMAAVAQGSPGQPALAVGQRWAYHARAADQGSSLVVLRIEPSPRGRIVHISLAGVHIKNPHCAAGFVDTVQHMPLAEAALLRSLSRLLESGVPLPDFEDGYREWKRDADAGKAGVYTITVAEVAQVMEDTLVIGAQTAK